MSALAGQVPQLKKRGTQVKTWRKVAEEALALGQESCGVGEGADEERRLWDQLRDEGALLLADIDELERLRAQFAGGVDCLVSSTVDTQEEASDAIARVGRVDSV